jgi:hypothetical protein
VRGDKPQNAEESNQAVRSKLLLAGSLLVLATTIGIVVRSSLVKKPLESIVGNLQSIEDEQAETFLDPSLKVLLEAPVADDPEHKSRFFTSLATLAGKNPNNFMYETNHWPIMDEGYAFKIRIADNFYVVAVLRGDTNFIPGIDAQRLILFEPNGHVLDKLSCEISNRLTRWYADSGQFRTDVLDGAKNSDAQLAIRYIPEKGGSVSGNWSHKIIYQGKTYSFYWDQGDPNNIRSPEWESKDHCRVAIRAGKLLVVFPELTKPLSND